MIKIIETFCIIFAGSPAKILALISITLAGSLSFASPPDKKSYEKRRPLPILMPASVFDLNNGAFITSEAHQGNQSITLSDGTRVDEESKFNGSVGAWLRLNDSFSASFIMQLVPFDIFLPMGAQIDWLIVKTERFQLQADVLYMGTLGLIFPSGAAQSVLKYKFIKTRNASAYLLLGSGWGSQYHFLHKVKDEGISSPSARYTGYLATQFNFVGLEINYRDFFITTRYSTASRKAGSNDQDRTIGEPPENYKADDGSFFSINIGMATRNL
ncbi:MAG: hypothetical protein K2Q26_02230 [Bdellovibrionales bacterium]|nr:hypothetical protein [Bdellovibrionales bacterium]